MEKEKMDAAMDNLRKMAEGLTGLLGIIGEEVTGLVNRVVSEAKEHKCKEHHHEEEKTKEEKTES